MKKARRNYEPIYKLEVVKMIKEQGLTLTPVCRDQTIGESAVRRWVRQYESELTGKPLNGSKPITPEQLRIRELEQQNRQLKQDVDILKKASAFFARELK